MNETITGSKVRDINWLTIKTKHIRGGIIPYVIIDHGDIQKIKTRFYAFGTENGIGSLIDFGGGRDHDDRSIIDTALREYEEETYNAFGKLNYEKIEEGIVIENEDMIDILIEVDCDPNTSIKEFESQSINQSQEIKSIIWVTRDQLITMMEKQHIVFAKTKTMLIYPQLYKQLKKNLKYI